MDFPFASAGLYVDRYELAMVLAHWRDGRAGKRAVFDYFFRTLPFDGGYAVFAGLADALSAVQRFRYSEEQLAFLSQDGFPDDFLDYLRDFRFRGSIWSASEGEIVFPLEPLVRVEGSVAETQLIETLLLNALNFQTLIATKAARCRYAAGQRSLSEFGLRRAQGLGGLWASRAACIGGFDTTSNMHAAEAYGFDAAGTMAHAFVQSFDSEQEAFRRFATVHGSKTVLLLDTYDTLRSGLPNALAIAREMRERGESLAGVRLDSGDLAYLSRKARAALDEAGFPEVAIVASNQLDERLIASLIAQDAPIALFGVGTSLATGAPDGALDGVYKLACFDEVPRLKASDRLSKSTLPGRKQVTRFRGPDGAFAADAIHLEEETTIPSITHPFEPGSQASLTGLSPEPLLHPVLEDGVATQPSPSAAEAARYAATRLSLLPQEHRRFDYPHSYKVGLSERLIGLRDSLLSSIRKEYMR